MLHAGNRVLGELLAGPQCCSGPSLSGCYYLANDVSASIFYKQLTRFLYIFSGEYSCLTVDLTFKREFSYYLLTIYVPCCMLVIVSWVSFWLDPNAVPARVSLGVTTLLTMSTQTASINNSLPPVAYTKAIDVWTGVSFLAILALFLHI